MSPSRMSSRGHEAVAVGREQLGVEVVHLVDDRRAGHPRRDHRLLVVDRPEAVADHLERDRIDGSDLYSRDG